MQGETQTPDGVVEATEAKGLSKVSTWRAVCAERCKHGFGKGRLETSETGRVELSIGLRNRYETLIRVGS